MNNALTLCRYAPFASLLPLALLLGLAASPASGQPTQRSLVLLSDLHFDPLQDPDKVPALVQAPIPQWPAILAAAPSPTQPARFAALQQACSGKDAADASYPLLQSALSAAKQHAQDAAFVTVSGDLLVHDLDCRYRMAMNLPASDSDDQSASASFAEKTTLFVIQQVESTFPRIPVYFALGNNDSACDHNRLNLHDAYLKAIVPAIVEGLRGVSPAETALAAQTFQSAGYYAVTMPPPMVNTRLLVLDDLYMMPKYAPCSGDAGDHQGADEQTAWLQNQLQQAATRHQNVWLLGHLPPVVNADSTLSGKAPFCPAGKVTRYQSSDVLADQIAANAATIKLAVFGHTHRDEFFLLPAPLGGPGVPVKVVGSVSPVSGNLPSFTLGSVNLASSTLADYSVFQASNPSGIATVWTREYSFDATYRQPAFSPDALKNIIAALRADPEGTSPDSRAYQQHRLKGSSGKKLSSPWPGYVCSLDHPTAKTFTPCVCQER